MRSVIAEPYRSHCLRYCSITDPSSLSTNGALFVPDPSLGAWASLETGSGASSVFPNWSNPHTQHYSCYDHAWMRLW